MRKLPIHLENPIDNIVYLIVEILSPMFHNFGLGPNSITTMSLLCGIYSGYLVYKRQYLWAIVLYSTAYIFDCTDGFNARKYNQETTFGDYYDHFSDIFKFIMVLGGCYLVNSKLFWLCLPVILLDSWLVMVHLGCQEIYYGRNDSDTLNFLGQCPTSCQRNAAEYLKWTRYFGTGSSTLLVIVIILFYKYFN
jgi:phosphatidylglycerophosphate synthase